MPCGGGRDGMRPHHHPCGRERYIYCLLSLGLNMTEGSKAGVTGEEHLCPLKPLVHPQFLACWDLLNTTVYSSVRVTSKSKFSPTNPPRVDKCLQKSLWNSTMDNKVTLKRFLFPQPAVHQARLTATWRKANHSTKTKRIPSFLKGTPRAQSL